MQVKISIYSRKMDFPKNGITWKILEKYARYCALKAVDLLAMLKFVK